MSSLNELTVGTQFYNKLIFIALKRPYKGVS